ncbi:hypothetical protein J6590_087086 [Homalodisca vitripennis]|nr:hypothetical protein J6590_100559 [Homalodisca vitripennis]KAG8309398.1 hypothetical protein J6590_087086 [Homalodisca vitripennis]
MYAVYGHYLCIYKSFFEAEYRDETWKRHLKINFNISDGYASNLISVGKLINKYPKLQNLSISVHKFLQIKKEINTMLGRNEEYRLFWKDQQSTVVSPMSSEQREEMNMY